MSITIRQNNLSLLNKLINPCIRKSSFLIEDLKFFQYLFAWYIELSPQATLLPHVKKSLAQIKNIRSIDVTWEFPDSVSSFSRALVNFSLLPTYTRSLELLRHSSEAASKGFSLLLWLKKIGVTNLSFLNKDLTKVFVVASSLISLSSRTAQAEKSLHQFFLIPKKATLYDSVYSVNRLAIGVLDFIPGTFRLLPLSLKTVDFLFGVNKKGIFLRIPPRKNPIPYLSR